MEGLWRVVEGFVEGVEGYGECGKDESDVDLQLWRVWRVWTVEVWRAGT